MIHTLVFELGTSNWTEDYFTTTAGQGFVFEPISESSNHDRDRSETDEAWLPADPAVNSRFNLRDQLEQIFHRDWTSKMAYPFKWDDQSDYRLVSRVKALNQSDASTVQLNDCETT